MKKMTETKLDFSNLTVIIPTLNEEKSLGELLSLIDENCPGCKVIVSDDGSKDKTKDITESCEGKIETLFLDRKEEEIHGLTVSVLDAILICSTPYFLVMDGDLQHPPNAIPGFLQLLQEEYELVAGNRIEIIGKWGIYRKLMSFVARLLGKLALIFRRRNRVKDVLSGLFASRTQIWKDFIEEKRHKFILEGYKVLFDFLKNYPRKLKVGHVDYVFGTRLSGESKISKKVIWLYFKSLF
jgi:dolichol-phosphate mannosyltransferase